MDKIKNAIFSILGALIVGAILILLSGNSPINAYALIVKGTFGDVQNVFQVLAFTTPLIFTGLGAAIAFQGGVFNIGGEGQLYVGGLAATLVGIYLKISWPWALIICLITAFIAGGLWALIPTLLVGRSSASLVVGTIMMNSIGVYLTDYLVKNFFLASGASNIETPHISAGAILPKVNSNTELTYGILIALILVVFGQFLLYYTTTGFSIRAIGTNPDASKQAGINVFHKKILTMIISGGICGLAGSLICLGVFSRFMSGFSPGYGWDGVTVAILAANSPIGVPLGAFLFGMLRAANISMNFGKSLPVDLITVFQAVIVLFIATPEIWKALRIFFAIRKKES